LARVDVNYKNGYIDKTGKMVIPPSFDYASDFSEGLVYVTPYGDKKFKKGYIDKSGNFVIKPRFDTVGRFPVVWQGWASTKNTGI